MGRDSGQVAVEAALVLPLLTAFGLGILQLASIEQARLFTEYAADQAARAGIVWNGNNERMQDAALFALLPTLGRTDDMEQLGQTWASSRRLDSALHDKLSSSAGGDVPEIFRAAKLLGMVRVDTISPAAYPALDGNWGTREGAPWQELDFDGVDTFPEDPRLDSNFDRFFDLQKTDSQQRFYRRATILSLRIRYLYEMKLPFANWVIFTAWYAGQAGRTLYGGLDRPTLDKSNALNRTSNLSGLAAEGSAMENERGLPTLTRSEMQTLWSLSTGEALDGSEARRFFIPLSATYSARMQSSFYRKWLMHLSPSWEP